MADINIHGSNALAQRLLDAWFLTAGSVAEGEALIKAKTIAWYNSEMERAEREAHENSFTPTSAEFT